MSPKKEIYTITEYPNLPNFLSKENQNAQIYNNTFSPLKENQNIQKYSYSPSKENPIVQKYGSPSSFKQRLPHLKEINTQNISKQRPMPRIIESRMQNYQIDSKVTNPLETNQENKENEEKNMSETLKEKNMFSKHIFEDKVVLEVLEKNMTGGLSRIPEKSINLENEYQTEGKEGKLVKRMNESDSDPYARMGHMVFKILSLLSYLMLGESTESKNMVYQTIIFLSAIDFWVVKNVTGRLLINR